MGRNTKNKRKLFGTSGIRGKIGSEVNAELGLKIGKALATYLSDNGNTILGKNNESKNPNNTNTNNISNSTSNCNDNTDDKANKVVIGYDPRTTNKMLESAITAGLLESGCDVLLLGMVPTPLVGYATEKTNSDAGIMITASHNPSQYNGMKLWNKNGMAYTQSQEEAIEDIYNQNNYIQKTWSEVGQVNTIEEVKDQYIEDLLNQVDIKKKNDNTSLKVVIDCASGAGSYFSPLIFRKAGCDVLSINAQADGHFPGRNPEPNKANLGDLMKIVKATGADIGIAHDGDADRMIAIDEEGKIGDFDKLLAIACKRYGTPVVTTVDAGMSIEECLVSNSLDKSDSQLKSSHVIRTKVGDVNVAEEIIKIGANFGGEPSGTWVHPEFCMCPDGILSGLILAEIVSKKGKLSELLAEIPNYPNIREKITCSAEEKLTVMNEVNSKFENSFDNVNNVNKIDGVRITLDDGSWILVRPSGTEDYVRITLESKTDEKAKEILKKSVDFINNILK